MPSGRWTATRDALPGSAGGSATPGAHLGVSSPGRAMICRGGQRAAGSASWNPIAFFTTDRRAVSTFVTGMRSMR